MKRIAEAGKWIGLVALMCAIGAPVAVMSQERGKAPSTDARHALVEKARALESRGRPDMAIQLWQQILLADPNNVEALEGLAKSYKLIGQNDKANATLEQLRKVDPKNANIAKIAGLSSTSTQSDQLRHAGELAKQGRSEDAMAVYHALYGERPPDGDIALAYYETLFGTANGKSAAIQAMRALANRNPGDGRYAVELGKMLTYDAKTRAEGVRLLEQHGKDEDAQAALRQALIWEADNPASAAQLRQFLKEHPQDTEIAGHLKENEAKLARMNAGIARTAAEKAAFAALNGNNLELAESRFQAILAAEPSNGRACAGMGFLRMRQNNFAGAVSYLTQAQEAGFKDASVEKALETARFWFTMNQATEAMNANQPEVAMSRFKAALEMRPDSGEALSGVAGLLMRQRKYTDAAAVYEQLRTARPSQSDAWRGAFLAYANDHQVDNALAISASMKEPMRAELLMDPEYVRALAAMQKAAHQTEEARRTLDLALALPFPGDGAHLSAEKLLQYAGILMDAGRYAQAAQLFKRVLDADPNSIPAWTGVVSAHHELGRDAVAIDDVEAMPPAAYEAALMDSGFLSLLGAIYAHANEWEVAQGLLERAIKQQQAAHVEPSAALQLQLANVYLQRNLAEQAYAIYRAVLSAHADNEDAWKGLINALQSSQRSAEALHELAEIPPETRRKMEADVEFLQAESSIYVANNDLPSAVERMGRVQAHYRATHAEMPASVAIQNAWMLYNTRKDRALYPALMALGARADLTDADRATVQTIWADWSVRRANTAMESGYRDRAITLLEAAANAFPDNLDVRKSVAAGYAQVGRARDAVILFKSVPMQDASATDYQSAVSAALAANNKPLAEQWLRQALDRYPRDARILQLAAHYEEARRDRQRAADYYRASLEAMPPTTPVERLAHTLAYPEQDARAHKATTPAELQQLLNPEYEPFPKTAKLPLLPAYGADPYTAAPVVLSAPQAPAQMPEPLAHQARTQTPSAPQEEAPLASNTTISAGGLRLSEQPANPAPAAEDSGMQMRLAQYTPSAQDAASSAYSAPKPSPAKVQESTKPADGAPSATGKPKAPAAKKNKKTESKPAAAKEEKILPLGQTTPEAAPTATPARVAVAPTPTVAAPASLASVPVEAAPEPVATTEGLSDKELQDRNLPPLRGPWVRVQRERQQLTPRDEAELALKTIESGYSGWLGASGVLNYRTGDLGYDHLAALESPFEVSMPLGTAARLTIIGKPVFLDSGAADGNSVITVEEKTTTGSAQVTIAQPIGTLCGPTGVTTTGTTSSTTTMNCGYATAPAQQNSVGIGGEVQLAFKDFAIAGGYTPYGFLVNTFTGRMQLRPAGGPFTFQFSRDPVKDTQLSYAGLRDPAGSNLSTQGQIWGGVTATGGDIQYTRGDAQSGFYLGGGGQYLAGYKVETNTRVHGTGGAYWRAVTSPEYGNLSVGANFFGMHYTHNEDAFTHGMGGYFSPQAYFLANAPITWNGHYRTQFHYNIMGSLGVQAFQTNEAALWPLAQDKALQTAMANASLPAKTSVGPNYDLRTQLAYQVGPHWFIGGFMNANNSRNYASVNAGFAIHYMWRVQPASEEKPTGLLPLEGLRPFIVP